MPENEVQNISMPESKTDEVEVDKLPVGEEGDYKIFGGDAADESSKEGKETEESEERGEVLEETEASEQEAETGGRSRPTVEQVTGKYPNFFKDFPELRHAFFREREFSSLFQDVDEAKEAVEQAKDFRFFEDKVVNGDAKTFLETVKDNGKENLASFANNFLPALAEVDNGTFLQATAPFVQNLLESAFREGNNAGNNDLKYSAAHLAKWIFGDMRYATGEAKVPVYKKAEKPVDKEREEFDRERQEFHQSRYQSAHAEVNDTAVSSVKDMIAEGLDPNDDLTEFVKDHIVEDTWKQIDRMLAKDEDHIRFMNRLWQNSQRSGFDRASRSKIIQAYLNRAKELMPDIRRQVKAKALGRKVTIVKESENTKGHVEVTGESRNGGSRKSRPTSAKEIDWKRTSDEDLFSGKVTYK